MSNVEYNMGKWIVGNEQQNLTELYEVVGNEK